MDRNNNTFTLDVNMPSKRTSGMNRILAEVKKKTLRSRILSALFGDRHEVIIIMPSREIRNVTFTRETERPTGKIAAETIISNPVEMEVASHEA